MTAPFYGVHGARSVFYEELPAPDDVELSSGFVVEHVFQHEIDEVFHSREVVVVNDWGDLTAVIDAMLLYTGNGQTVEITIRKAVAL